MRPNADSDNAELKRVLEELLKEDVTISLREVARRHRFLKNASALSRNSDRRRIIDAKIEEQERLRSLAETSNFGDTGKSLQARLAESQTRIDELEHSLKALVASHAACVKAVYETGGSRRLQEFWRTYENIARTLRELDAMPAVGNVIDLPGKQKAPISQTPQE